MPHKNASPGIRLRPGIPHGPHPDGFTLIEIVAVVFILSLLLGLVAPSLSSFSGHKAQSDAKRIAGTLRYIHDSALGSKKTFSLTADLDRRTLRYEIPEGIRSENSDTLSAVEVQSRGMITTGEITLHFGPLGGQERVVFHLDDAGRRSYTVTFSPLSGRVRISHDERVPGDG